MHTADGRYEVVVNKKGKWFCIASINNLTEAMHIANRVCFRTVALLDMKELKVISHRGSV